MRSPLLLPCRVCPESCVNGFGREPVTWAGRALVVGATPGRDWYFIAEQPAPAPHLAHPLLVGSTPYQEVQAVLLLLLYSRYRS